MPYVKREYREGLDRQLYRLFGGVQGWMDKNNIPKKDIDGIINYMITQILKWYYNYDEPNYSSLMNAVGTLEQVKDEWQRRVIHPYEDKRKKEEGDVYESST